jgi:tRNA1(Val) A37 N6-methylase TrmN6
MLSRFDTPIEVAQRLATYAPARIQTILDPSVGSGVLLKPLLSKLKRQKSRVFCVDSDRAAISKLRLGLGRKMRTNISLVHADFLTWFSAKQSMFDCIIMNPPFAAGKSHWRTMTGARTADRAGRGNTSMPVEAAFICAAVDLLRDGGCLLTVLPSSVIMSDNLAWLRDVLRQIGSIRLVHELPPRSFVGVESRMYLLVFEKTKKEEGMLLLNHDLARPRQLKLDLSFSRTTERFDFGFHRAIAKLGRLRRHKRVGWKPLREVASVIRGSVRSPIRQAGAVHTTNYEAGFWKHTGKRPRTGSKSDAPVNIRRGDLLIQRVGRNCRKSVGFPCSLTGMSCSDCVIIIRPYETSASRELLFGLRTFLECDWARPLLERGTGASYISHASLLDIFVPTLLHECLPKTYQSFLTSLKLRSSEINRRAITYAVDWLSGLD